MIHRANLRIAALLIIGLAGCSRGGNLLIVGDIKGPDTIAENSSAEFKVEASGDSGIVYAWVTNPIGIGAFNHTNTAAIIFTAPEVDADTDIVIRLVVTSDKDGPVVRSREITITDTGPPDEPDEPDEPPVNHAPLASAYVLSTEVGIEEDVKFFDTSTDHDGIDDIVKWEWDFSYDSNVGFVVDSDAREPVHSYPIEGMYEIQLRVEDNGGLSDMLDAPLTLTVIDTRVPPVALASLDKDNVRTGETIQFTDESEPPPDEEIVKWEWDFSYDEAEGFVADISERNASHNYVEPGQNQIQLRITASNGRTDMLDEPLTADIRPWGEAYVWTASDPEGILEDRPCIYSIASRVDDQGYVYIVGYLSGLVDVDPSPGVEEVFGEPYSKFFMKLDPEGNFLWIKKWEPCPEDDLEVIILSSGDVIMGGNYFGTWDTDPGPAYRMISGKGMYAIRIDSDGHVRSKIDIHDGGWDDYYHDYYIIDYTFQNVAADESNDSLILIYEYLEAYGSYYYDVTLGEYLPNDPIVIADDDLYRAYPDYGSNEELFEEGDVPDYIVGLTEDIAFTRDNNMLIRNWYNTISLYPYLDFENEIWEFDLDEVGISNMKIDSDDRILLSGRVYEKVDIDPSPEDYFLTPKGDTDSFIAAYDMTPELLWACSFGSEKNGYYREGCSSIDLNNQGELLAGGIYYDNADLDPGQDVRAFPAYGITPDIYVSLFNQDMRLVDVGTFHSYDDCGIDSVLAGGDNITWAVGWFQSNLDLDPGPGEYIAVPTMPSWYNMFVYRFDW